MASAYEDGAPPGYTGGFGEDDCRACHSDNRRNHRSGQLRIDGFPEKFQAGRRYALTVTLTHEQLESAGLQLSVRHGDGSNAGALQSDDVTLAVQEHDSVDYLQHLQATEAGDGQAAVAWNVTWTAPAEGGPIVLHVAANAANGDSSALGDFVYLASVAASLADVTD